MAEVGRPPLFKDPEEVEALVQEYFEKGVKMRTVILGPPNARYEIQVPVPTITGLAIYLGFESRQSFYDYESKPEFSYTIKKARLFIENEYEEMLQTGNTTGAIFALKNFGWTDKQEIDQTNRHSGEIKHTIDHSKLSESALREIATLDQPEISQD